MVTLIRKITYSVTAFSKIKFKHFQGPSDTDSRTFKDHVCFQGLSRPWKSGIIPGLSRTHKSPV